MPQIWPASLLEPLQSIAQDWKVVHWKLKENDHWGPDLLLWPVHRAALLGGEEARPMTRMLGWSLELSELRMGATNQDKVSERWEGCISSNTPHF
jgi:hypothetical protein